MTLTIHKGKDLIVLRIDGKEVWRGTLTEWSLIIARPVLLMEKR